MRHRGSIPVTLEVVGASEHPVDIVLVGSWPYIGQSHPDWAAAGRVFIEEEAAGPRASAGAAAEAPATKHAAVKTRLARIPTKMKISHAEGLSFLDEPHLPGALDKPAGYVTESTELVLSVVAV
jgi:hypothetical protein